MGCDCLLHEQLLGGSNYIGIPSFTALCRYCVFFANPRLGQLGPVGFSSNLCLVLKSSALSGHGTPEFPETLKASKAGLIFTAFVPPWGPSTAPSPQ